MTLFLFGRIFPTVVNEKITCALSEASVDNDDIPRFSLLQNSDSIVISTVITEPSMAGCWVFSFSACLYRSMATIGMFLLGASDVFSSNKLYKMPFVPEEYYVCGAEKSQPALSSSGGRSSARIPLRSHVTKQVDTVTFVVLELEWYLNLYPSSISLHLAPLKRVS